MRKASIDHVGRVYIPREIQRLTGLGTLTNTCTIVVQEGSVRITPVFKHRDKTCTVCRCSKEAEHILRIHGALVCEECAAEMQKEKY